MGETVTWSGAVVDGKAHGTGVVQWFTNGIPTSRYVRGNESGPSRRSRHIILLRSFSVEGEFKDGRLISKIVTVRNSGEGWYRGEHIDGVKNGQGEEVMKGGVRYNGRFKQGRFDGAGVMIWPNGDKLRSGRIRSWPESAPSRQPTVNR